MKNFWKECIDRHGDKDWVCFSSSVDDCIIWYKEVLEKGRADEYSFNAFPVENIPYIRWKNLLIKGNAYGIDSIQKVKGLPPGKHPYDSEVPKICGASVIFSIDLGTYPFVTIPIKRKDYIDIIVKDIDKIAFAVDTAFFGVRDKGDNVFGPTKSLTSTQKQPLKST